MALSYKRRDYNLEFDFESECLRVAGWRDRAILAIHHFLGRHPLLPCYRVLASGAQEGLSVCFVCGAQIGLPRAREAAKWQLTSPPGQTPVQVRPTMVPPDLLWLLKLEARTRRLVGTSGRFWALGVICFLASVVLSFTDWYPLFAALNLLTVGCAFGCLFFFLRSRRAEAVFSTALGPDAREITALAQAAKDALEVYR